MKMTLTKKIVNVSLAIQAITFVLVSGCVGTEVGNGLKPNDDEKRKESRAAGDQQENQPPKVQVPNAGSVSQDAAKAPLDISFLRTIFLPGCGSPLHNATQADLVLSRKNDVEATEEVLFNATVAAGVWTLSEGGKSYTVTPSGSSNFKGKTNIKDSYVIEDAFTCGGVSRSAITVESGSQNPVATYSTEMTRISDGKKYKVAWIASVDSTSAVIEAEYRLQQVTVDGADGFSTVFAIYPAQ